VKALIPAAGAGTRLRPHTHSRPKVLLPVADRPLLAHVIDPLAAAGVDRFVVIVGHHGQAVRAWLARERPDLDAVCVEQAPRRGLAHAIWTAREAVGQEPCLCVLGDTILTGDLAALLACPDDAMAVCPVDDPRRFGVVVTRGDRVTACVEKPADPPGHLAAAGAYLFRDPVALMAALEEVMAAPRHAGGEVPLAAGLQRLLVAGHVLRAVEIGGWLDCGTCEAWLAANRALLDRDHADERGWVHPTARVGASRLGPHVSIGPDVVLEDCEIREAVIGAGSVLRGCRLHASLVGQQCRLEGVAGVVNVGDHCESTTKEQR
jgi:glucose-1-phosphate thymidylyltransferase